METSQTGPDGPGLGRSCACVAGVTCIPGTPLWQGVASGGRHCGMESSPVCHGQLWVPLTWAGCATGGG